MIQSFGALHNVKNVVDCVSCIPVRTKVNTKHEETWTTGGKKFILKLDMQHQSGGRLRAVPITDIQTLSYNKSIIEERSLVGIQRLAEEDLAAGMSSEGRQRMLAESLDAAARLNPFREITDPVAWQREIRRDRPLPGREGPSC